MIEQNHVSYLIRVITVLPRIILPMSTERASRTLHGQSLGSRPPVPDSYLCLARYYPQPSSKAAHIKGHVAFYKVCLCLAFRSKPAEHLPDRTRLSLQSDHILTLFVRLYRWLLIALSSPSYPGGTSMTQLGSCIHAMTSPCNITHVSNILCLVQEIETQTCSPCGIRQGREDRGLPLRTVLLRICGFCDDSRTRRTPGRFITAKGRGSARSSRRKTTQINQSTFVTAKSRTTLCHGDGNTVDAVESQNRRR